MLQKAQKGSITPIEPILRRLASEVNQSSFRQYAIPMIRPTGQECDSTITTTDVKSTNLSYTLKCRLGTRDLLDDVHLLHRMSTTLSMLGPGTSAHLVSSSLASVIVLDSITGSLCARLVEGLWHIVL